MTRTFLAKTVVFGCLATTALGYNIAHAKDPELYFFPAQKWEVTASEVKDDSGMPSCTLSSRFNNGYIVQFAGNAGGFTNINIDFRQDTFEAGRKYEAKFSVPGVSDELVPTQAFKKNLLVSDMRMRKSFTESLIQASVLDVEVSGNQFRFYMTGLGAALKDFSACTGEPAAAKDAIPADEEMLEAAADPVKIDLMEPAAGEKSPAKSSSLASVEALEDKLAGKPAAASAKPEQTEKPVSVEVAPVAKAPVQEIKSESAPPAPDEAELEASAASKRNPFFSDTKPSKAPAPAPVEAKAEKKEVQIKEAKAEEEIEIKFEEEPAKEDVKPVASAKQVEPEKRERFTDRLFGKLKDKSKEFTPAKGSNNDDHVIVIKSKNAEKEKASSEKEDVAALESAEEEKSEEIKKIETKQPKEKLVEKHQSSKAKIHKSTTETIELDLTEAGLDEEKIEKPAKAANEKIAKAKPALPPVEEIANIEPASSQPVDSFVDLRNKIVELEKQVNTLSNENTALEEDLKESLQASKDERMSVSSDNWNLERATMRFNEAERQLERLGRQIKAQKSQCESEKAELEGMLFDPQVTNQQQLAKLSSLEAELEAAQTDLRTQQRTYEERIKLLENQLNGE